MGAIAEGHRADRGPGPGVARRLGAMVVSTVLLLTSVAGAQNFGVRPGERWFRVDWSVEPGAGETRRISGYVYSDYGRPAADVRILVEALDGQQKVFDRRFAWVPGQVPPLSRAYFRVPEVPAAAEYRVSVHSYTFLEGTGDGFL
jgi:hypothetical protein